MSKLAYALGIVPDTFEPSSTLITLTDKTTGLSVTIPLTITDLDKAEMMVFQDIQVFQVKKEPKVYLVIAVIQELVELLDIQVNPVLKVFQDIQVFQVKTEAKEYLVIQVLLEHLVKMVWMEHQDILVKAVLQVIQVHPVQKVKLV